MTSQQAPDSGNLSAQPGGGGGILFRADGFSLTLQGSDGRKLPVLEGVTLEIARGRCLGIAGESGSGKSILGLSILGLVPCQLVAGRAGKLVFDGLDLCDLAESRFRTLRGNRIAMVFQEPMTAMNPLLTLREQIGEMISTHRPGTPSGEVRQGVLASLIRAGFSEPEKFLESFPHQLSGGMRQRGMLAMALALDPDLVIADEPTTALDAGLQLQLLSEMRGSVVKNGRAMMFISHDLGVIRTVADDLAVMYSGLVLERGGAREILGMPFHPYTRALIQSLPRLSPEKVAPRPIPGHLPPPDRKPPGCVFSDRCTKADDECRKTRPEPREIEPGRWVRCFHPWTGAA